MIHSDNDFATVAYLRIKSATLQDKEKVEPAPTVPSLLEEEYEEIQNRVQKRSDSEQHTISPSPPYAPADAVFFFPSSASRRESWIAITATRTRRFDEEISLEDEVHECFRVLQGTPLFPLSP